MQAMTPISPLERTGDAFVRAKMMSGFLEAFDRPSVFDRPISVATEATEFEGQEDDFSDYDSRSIGRSPSPASGKRRSRSTIDSLDEAPTPKSGRGQRALHTLSVEGPRGPHLFRSSQQSVDFDMALQMSPLLPKQMDLRIDTALTPETMTKAFMLTNRSSYSDTDADSEVRRWTSTKVIEWLIECNMDSTVVACFENNDITGDVLMDLVFDDLKDLGIESFGKRHSLWNALCVLQGRDEEPSPCQTTFNDIDRPCTTDDLTGKKRRARKASKTKDIVTPNESVSIVAIEQLMPRPHKCNKGERCAKWRQQQRECQRLRDEHELGRWPISPTKGGHIFVAGNPGNVTTAEHMPQAFAQHQPDDFYRPASDAIPSIVASSDLLGPGQLPELLLHADTLQQLDKRDPQDNVKAFLNFQHINSPGIPLEDDLTDQIMTPVQNKFSNQFVQLDELELFPPEHVQNFTASHDAQPAAQFHQRSQSALDSTQRQTSLDVPRSSSAQGSADASRTITASPGLYRFATPASEMDVPVATEPISARATSRSVPPDMQYRQQRSAPRSQSRQGKWRRPSAALESVKENEVLAPSETPRPSISTQRSGSSGCISFSNSSTRTMSLDPAHDVPEVKVFGYGADCTQAGWMRKRRTKLLRHEWQDAHFRLRGTELAMHMDEKYHSAPKETIDVDQYSVACNAAASSSKLGAAFKSLAINTSPEKTKDATAFAFQLVPEGKDRELFAKTHHFAVKSKDERIDWMRELMLAKALQQKREGYEVEINGVQA